MNAALTRFLSIKSLGIYLLFLFPCLLLQAQEITVAELKPGNTTIPVSFISQFEGRMAVLMRGKIKNGDKAFTEGVLKYNLRRTGEKLTQGKEDKAKAKAEGNGTEGFSRYLNQASLEKGKPYLLDVSIKKIRPGDGLYPYFIDMDVTFADRVYSCVAVNAETLTNSDRELAGIPTIEGSAIKPLSEKERGELKDWAMNVVKDPKVDSFKITDTVKMKNAPGSGANIVLDSFSHWKGNRMTNIWNRQAGFEPIVFRHVNTVGKGNASTVDYLEHNTKGGFGGIGFWQTYPTGFWDGANFEIYRMKGQYYELLHKGKVKKWVAERDQEERFYFDTPSPEAPQEDDFYLLTMDRDDLPACVSEGKKNFQGLTVVGDAVMALDRTSPAPESGSTTSLCMTLPGGKKSGFEHFFVQDKQGWTKLSEGKKYIAEIWMKQEGLDKDVTLQLGHLGSEKFKVGTDWKKYTHTFDYKPEPEKLQALSLTTDGAGKLWLDNFIVYEEGTPPFRFLPQYQKALSEWKPESLRYLTQGIEFYRTLDSVLQKDFTEKSMFIGKGKQTNMGPTTAGSLFTLLDAARQTGANPWINTFVYTEEECLGLIEYLAGPATSPYGKIRAEQHGQVEPWTNVFKKIYIEMGNECWNSPVFDPLSFPGRPDRHAALANRMYRAMKKSPYYSNEKFDLIAGGHSHNPSYSGSMVKNTTESDMLAVANYIGGWDGFTVLGGDDSALFQRQLLYPAQVVAPEMEAIVKELEKNNRATGSNAMNVAIYEYGPGYALPSAAKPYVDESEEVGKSLALGIATLDMHLLWLNDFGFSGPQGYFNFQTGVNWTSHSDGDSMRPIAAWQALELRNKYCPGDLMKVETLDVKTIDVPDSLGMQINWKGEKKEMRIKGRNGIPMVRCYAFKDGKNHSVLLLNRLYSEARTVKLDLSMTPKPEGSIHSLSYKESRATNRDELLYGVEEKKVDNLKQNYEITLPPCSATVLSYSE